jgi:GNAT superfamily N-acetyltransferase
MAWTLTASRDEYLAVAGGFLRSRPVHNTIQLVALDSLGVRGPSAFGDVAPLFGWWRPGAGPVTAALLHTPPFPVLLESWLAAFRQELADLGGPGAGLIEDRISHGGLTLWEAGGAPVSLAGGTRPVEGVVRLGPVYTPPEHRGRGYGGAVTAAVSRAALAAGAAHVVLFTDRANPTSNALYHRLGYRPVEDRLVLKFGPQNLS